MKKALSLVLLVLLLAGLTMPASASVTGASREEAAVYNTTGYAGRGLPSHATKTMGAEAGAKFVAGKQAQAQSSPAEMVQALVAAGMTPQDAISFVIKEYFTEKSDETGEILVYWASCAISYTVASQEEAYLYIISNKLDNAVRANDYPVLQGTGVFDYDIGCPAYFWKDHPGVNFTLTLEKSDLGESFDKSELDSLAVSNSGLFREEP